MNESASSENSFTSLIIISPSRFTVSLMATPSLESFKVGVATLIHFSPRET